MRFSLPGRLQRFLSAGRWVAGAHRTLLNLDDLWGDDHSALHLHFENAWKTAQEAYQEGESPEKETLLFSQSTPGFSVLYTLWLMFRPSLIVIVLLRLTTDLLSLFGPFTLRWVILFCERQPVCDWMGYIYSLVVLASMCSYTIFQHLLEGLIRRTAATAGVTISSALYRKKPRPAHVLSVMSEEVEQMVRLLVRLLRLFTSPLRVALCLSILWWEMGAAMLIGGTMLVLLTPLGLALERHVRIEQCSQVTFRTESENLFKEMIFGIKALKLLALDPWFQHRLAEVWERELETLRTLGYLMALSMLSHVCLPFLVCMSTLGMFVLWDDGNVLTPSQVFMCLCFLRPLRSSYLELLKLPSLLKQVQDSLSRLEDLFMTEDLDTKNVRDLSQESWSSNNILQHCNSRCNNKNHCNTELELQLAAHKGIGGALRWYLGAFGWHWTLLTLLTQLVVCVVTVAQDVLLCVWTGEAKDVQGLEEWREVRDSRLTIYTLLGLLQALLVCWVACCLCHGSLQASQSLRDDLLFSLLHFPHSSHQTTDPTQLLHSFTQGICVVDDHVPKHLHIWGSCLLEMIGTMLLITFIIPVFSLAVCPLIFVFLGVQSHFSSVQRKVRQTEVSSKMELCLNHRLQILKQNIQVHYNSTSTDGWVLLRLDAAAVMSLFFITFVLLQSSDSLDSGVIALALAFGFNVKEVMHQYSLTTAEIVWATQRICVYTNMEKKEIQLTDFEHSVRQNGQCTPQRPLASPRGENWN